MAREHGRILTAIWSDADFRRLTPGAQHLYLMLVTAPTLSYCGVADWRPKRLRALAEDWDPEAFDASADLLIRRLYIVIDDDTEEALVRSFIRNDGLMKQRHMGVSMAKAYSAVASAALRGVIVHELVRLHREDGELRGWQSEQVRKLLTGEAIDPSTYPLGHGAGDPPVQPLGQPPVQPPIQYEPHPEGHPPIHPPTQPPSTPSPSPTPSPDSNSGYVSEYVTEGDGRDENTPPPIRCASHIDNPTTAACRPCGDARKARKAWDAEQVEASKRARSVEVHEFAHATALAIADCGLCDDHGYLGTMVCDHDPDTTERAGRGMELIRREMGWEA